MGVKTVRANKFDAVVGMWQTRKSISMGVGESLLDIGCGIGQYTPMFCDYFSMVVGLDPDEKNLKIARSANTKVAYVYGWGETFKLNQKFDTINMTNLLEHVDSPVKLLKNCKEHLNKGGRIIAQVPNSLSITRRLGVLMDLIDSTNDISDKERYFYGHQRVYTLKTLERDFKKAGLKIVESGGILYKPLPNEDLYKIYCSKTETEKELFMQALIEFGKDRPNECAQIYVCAR